VLAADRVDLLDGDGGRVAGGGEVDHAAGGLGPGGKREDAGDLRGTVAESASTPGATRLAIASSSRATIGSSAA
jgi:hypothetical protein